VNITTDEKHVPTTAEMQCGNSLSNNYLLFIKKKSSQGRVTYGCSSTASNNGSGKTARFLRQIITKYTHFHFYFPSRVRHPHIVSCAIYIPLFLLIFETLRFSTNSPNSLSFAALQW